MFLLCMAVSIVMQIAAQTDPLWLRYPSISPDGKTIVFSYKGDIYKVPSSGGDAIPLTLHESYDYMPVWSHDGKWLAFASDRYGNFDVFIMPSSGGEAKRLTYHSANDYPYDFTPDNKKVLNLQNSMLKVIRSFSRTGRVLKILIASIILPPSQEISGSMT